MAGVAAVITVLSLINGARSLIDLQTESQDEQATVTAALAAARLMAQTGQFKLAWAQLDQASEAIPEPDLLDDRVEVALGWLRRLVEQRLDKQSATQTADLLTPFLYRRLADREGRDALDIYAHIAWADYLKGASTSGNESPILHLEETIAADETNVYAHTFAALMKGRERGFHAFAEAVAHFEAATSPGDQDWAKKTHLAILGELLDHGIRRGANLTTTQQIVARLLTGLSAYGQRIEQSSAIATWLSRLDADQIAVVDDLVSVLEPNAYIGLLEHAHRNRTLSTAARYLLARLEELRGNPARASAHLQAMGQTVLTNSEATRRLVNPMLIRLGREPQAPDTERKYAHDPMPPDADPMRFHLDTLLNFNLAWRGDNFIAAAEYFSQLPAPLPDATYGLIMTDIKKSRDRAKTYVDDGKKHLLQRDPSSTKHGSPEITRWTLSAIWYLAGHIPAAQQDWDVAITEWADLHPRIAEGITVDWELAVAHGHRMAQNAADAALNNHDQERALHYLNVYIDRLRSSDEAVPWAAIASEPAFKPLRASAAFLDLLKGRL